jgi:hypothetical protein
MFIGVLIKQFLLIQISEVSRNINKTKPNIIPAVASLANSFR